MLFARIEPHATLPDHIPVLAFFQQTPAVAGSKLRKLRHDPVELTRAVQPAP
jgi:hypothetical protein